MVGVSIVEFNTKDLLKKTLNVLTSGKNKEKLEIYVVDNNSTDGSFEMVKKEFPKVNLIENNSNVGFAKAQNQALKKIKSEYALILNPDTDFNVEVIDRMVEFMDSNPHCGISSCKLVGFDNNLHSNGGDFPLGLSLLSWLFNLESFGIKTNFHRSDPDYYGMAQEVDWVGGTFMFVRQEVFKKVGYFNEEYFMYFEDTDFCYKAKKTGFSIMINPNVVVKHKSGASSKNPRLNQWIGEFKGLCLFYKREFGVVSYMMLKILIYLSIILRMAAFLILGKGGVARIYGRVITSI